MKIFSGVASPVLSAIRPARETGENCAAYYASDFTEVFRLNTSTVEDKAIIVNGDGVVVKSFPIIRVGF